MLLYPKIKQLEIFQILEKEEEDAGLIYPNGEVLYIQFFSFKKNDIIKCKFMSIAD